MEHRIKIGGKEKVIDIRGMDEDVIVWRKMFTAPLTADNMETADPEYLAEGRGDGRFEVFKEFFRRQIQDIGSCMILAWDGDGVIGKMHFTTREMADAIGGPELWDSPTCYCVDHGGFAPAIRKLSDADLTKLLSSPSRTLRILCFNVGHTDPRWHGHGIAKAMVAYIKQWAGERSWRRIEIRSCPDIVPTNVIGDWMLRRGPLERLGFRVIDEAPADPAEAAERLRVIKNVAAGKKDHPRWADWYVRNFRRLAADPTWESTYDMNYLMGCDL